MDDVLQAPAFALAESIAKKQVSPVSVLDAHIRRIETVNPHINAIVADRFDQAMEEAREAEKRVTRRGRKPPLLGVPCTVKEFIAVEGQPHTAGLWARRHHRAEQDATIVQRLKKAGAIIMGSTNAPEGGLWWETHNILYGRTSNPWDLHRTPGGSSGGEGAIIAAGGSPFGLGSDTGGSIRIPAAMCGIAGHKPTGGALPNTGHYPHAPAGDLPIMQCGPMARSATDLWPLMQILAGPDDQDTQCRDWGLQDPKTVSLSDITVYPMPGNGRAFVRKPVRQAVLDAAAALEDRGASTGALTAPDLGRSFEIWAALLSDGAERYDRVVGDGAPVQLVSQLLKYPLGRSEHAASVLLLLTLERLLEWVPGQTAELAAATERLRAHLEAGLGPDGVLIHPVYARTAPRHRGFLVASPFDASLTTAFNITTLPATVVPVGRDAKGLPLAVQIVARRGNDHLCLAVAEALEDSFGRLPVAEPSWGRALPLGLRLA